MLFKGKHILNSWCLPINFHLTWLQTLGHFVQVLSYARVTMLANTCSLDYNCIQITSEIVLCTGHRTLTTGIFIYMSLISMGSQRIVQSACIYIKKCFEIKSIWLPALANAQSRLQTKFHRWMYFCATGEINIWSVVYFVQGYLWRETSIKLILY